MQILLFIVQNHFFCLIKQITACRRQTTKSRENVITMSKLNLYIKKLEKLKSAGTEHAGKNSKKDTVTRWSIP